LIAAGTIATTAESAPALELDVEDVAGVELLELVELMELLELLLLPHAARARAQSTVTGARRQLFQLSIDETLSLTPISDSEPRTIWERARAALND
jgi:hypothetical protein